MNPETLRTLLPAFNRFELPKAEATANYLSHYDLNFVATGDAAQQTIGLIAHNHQTLVGQAFFATNASANALIVHGYMDHSGLYGKLIRHLLAQNINVFIIDLPGHGLSSGQQASIDNFEQYCGAVTALHTEALKNCAQGPWFLFGQSMGGAIAMSLLQKQQLDIAKTVLLAPLVQPRAWRSLKWAHSLLKHVICAMPRSFSGNSHDRVFTQFIKHHDTLQTQTMPIAWINAMRVWRGQFLSQSASNAQVLLIQGTGDQTIDWRYGNHEIARLFPNHKTMIINDGMHHLANESDAYLQPVLSAIDHYLFDSTQI